jgi:hypothetical protein
MYNGSIPMNMPMNEISHVLSCGNCWLDQNGLHKRSGCGEQNGTKQTASKYIVDNNSVVYEQYDRYGKLILRVPWSAHLIDVKY